MDPGIRHLAIIPDGNRRWGKRRGITANLSHRNGAENFRNIFREAFRSGIPYVTFWMASEDNLKKRSRAEAIFLARLLVREISSSSFVREMAENDISVRIIGRGAAILHDPRVDRAIREIEQWTADFKKVHLTILFGYDGTAEMLDAVKKIASAKTRTIDEAALTRALWTGFLPPVDLVLRTGEEDAGWIHQSSGFMMWKTAQSEFYATKTLWPDFSSSEFRNMLAGYARRERRRGK